MINFKVKRLVDENPVLCNQLKALCFDINGCCQTVHREMGPYLNEYMYQDALKIIFDEQNIPYQKEYYFSVDFHGQRISHKHYVDFFCKDKLLLECKAIEQLGTEQRQQLWNYMRLTNIPVGILYNFAPIYDQCEHYYLNPTTQQMYVF